MKAARKPLDENCLYALFIKVGHRYWPVAINLTSDKAMRYESPGDKIVTTSTYHLWFIKNGKV